VNIIITNKQATYKYYISSSFEAGIVLLGWEVKSIRQKRIELIDSFVTYQKNCLVLNNMLLNPINTICMHTDPEINRKRVLLLHKKEINRIKVDIKQKNYTVIPLCLYWDKQYIKVKLGMAKGKKLYDKRNTIKNHDWLRNKDRLIKYNI
jgi:SsrA-binding protein